MIRAWAQFKAGNISQFSSSKAPNGATTYRQIVLEGDSTMHHFLLIIGKVKKGASSCLLFYPPPNHLNNFFPQSCNF